MTQDKNIAVRFDSVSFSYGNVHVLENASFHIHKGEFTAIIGPNGSGKTTVLKLLFGLETPNAGSIKITGSTAYVSQQMPADNLFPITVKNVVRMGLLRPLGGYAKDKQINDAAEEAMEKTGITDLALRQYRSLSGGQKRRALVARALAARPQLLVLDEPTANMDTESENRLYETLGSCKGKTTILVVTHDTGFVSSLTDRVLCLGAGDRSIVQHRTEINTTSSACLHHGSVSQDMRVLHGENIPGDECCRV